MRNDTLVEWQKKIELTLKELIRSLDNKIDFEKLAKKAASSPYHFHRVFKSMTGETVNECIRRLRLERSIKALRETNLKITEIAYDAGYESLEGYNKAFRKKFGMTPTQLKKLPHWYGVLESKAGVNYGKGENWFLTYDEKGQYMKTKILELPEMTFVTMKCKGNYWNLPKTWQKFMPAVYKSGLTNKYSKFMSIFPDHHNDKPMEDKITYAAMSLEKVEYSGDEFEVVTVPAGLYAICVHFGSSEEIGPVWEDWNKNWLSKSGWEVDNSRPSLEWYQNNPETISTELLLTFLCDPVKKKEN